MSLRCTSEDGQCHCLPNMVGRRCSEPANGYFLPQLDYFLYEAELATPLYDGGSPPAQPTAPSSSSSLVRNVRDRILGKHVMRFWEALNVFSAACPQLNTGISPQCEQYFRQQGYDFKLSNGRVVLVRRTRRRARQRRQGQVRELLGHQYDLMHFCKTKFNSESFNVVFHLLVSIDCL